MYDPRKSHISAATLEQFLQTPSTASVLKVPGIGKKSATILEEEGIHSIDDLLQKKTNMFDSFFDYLKKKLKGVNRHRIYYALERYDEDDNLLGEDAQPSLITELEQADQKCTIS
tara:strand:- start:4164 stop:4508 length:345 start_codon:yes stop_codon:yes gene_type:complete